MRRFPLFLTLFLLLATTLTAHSSTLTDQQQHTLQIAYDEGSRVTSLGETFPITTQLVVMQESRAGAYGRNRRGHIIGDQNNPLGEKSYGPAQVRLRTAKFVLTLNPELNTFDSDEELLFELIDNTRFNIRVAAHYIAYLWELTEGDFRATLLAYNRGPFAPKDGRDPNNYVARCLQHLHMTITPFNANRI